MSFQVTCVINNFKQMQLSATPHRHHAVQSVQAVPMLALPCGENPLEKLSGPQVRGERESVQWGQDRVVKISPSGGHFQKKCLPSSSF